jgi:hypothetical protein
LVALLGSAVPVIHFLTLDAFTFLTSATALSLIRRRRHVTPLLAGGVREPVWSGIMRGFRATARHPLLGYYLAVSGPLNGVWYAVFYLCLPVFLGGRTLPARPQFQMLGGNIQGGCGILLLAAANFLPPEWRLTGFAAASALTAMGGPMQDIPTAVLRQTRLPPSDRPAAMRAYMAVVCIGILVAMLLTPVVIALIGVTRLVAACAAVYLCVAALGLARFAGWRDAGLEQSA